jgi:transposase
VEGTPSTIDPTIAARLAELEAMVAAAQAALETERALRADAEAERDRLREAYHALQLEVELARRRLVVAKAERVDTTQLELEFAAKLAALDKLAGLVDGDGNEEGDESGGDHTKKPKGKRPRQRDLRKAPIGEERLEIPDPVWEGKAERIGADEESCELVWRRGGFVRLVIARIKYRPPQVTTGVSAGATGVDLAASAAGTDLAASATGIDTAASTTSINTAASTIGGAAAASMTDAPAANIVASIDDVVPTTPDEDASTTIVTAPMPLRLWMRSYATPSLVAHVASDKFCDGLPLHRQEDRFARLGVTLYRSTMCRWLEEAGAIVGATIVEAMRKEALVTAFCIATDATGVLVQPLPRPDKKHQPCRRAHFFVQIADADHVFFEYTPVETSQVVSELFRGFAGFVQADAKSVYDVLFRPAKERDRIDDDQPDRAVCREVGCWSHARTGCWEAAVATQDGIAREALARIMRMFQLERLWKEHPHDERKALRDRHLRPHVESFFEFVAEEFERVKHQRGMLRSALGYCIRQKDALMRFLEDGRLEMTNNHSERQLRKIACGRKAWLFVGSDDHGQAAGNLLTLIASARLHKLDPEVYLRDVFRVLPHWPRDRYLELAPRYWRITRARLDRAQLERELGDLTIPEPALPTAVPASIPAELRPAP